MDSWFWNLVPLGIVKIVGNRWGQKYLCGFGPTTMLVRQIGGVLIRALYDGFKEAKQ